MGRASAAPGRNAARLASWRALALTLSLATCVLPAHSGALGVNPIRVGLSAAAPTAAITLNNSGNAAMVLQLQIAKWSAAAGEDRYDPSDDLLVTPPIFSIAPGTSQIVRIGLGSAVDPQRELAYRLFIEEVPPPPKPGYQGLRVALRIGVPVFVEPTQATAKAALQWTATRADANAVVIQASNAGNAHARVLGIVLRAAGEDRVLATHTAAAYLLPGQTKAWTLRLERPWRGSQLRLSATTEQGAADADLELRNP